MVAAKSVEHRVTGMTLWISLPLDGPNLLRHGNWREAEWDDSQAFWVC